GYVITFENGWTVYFSGSSAATAEQGLWASMYRPNLAILHMGGDHEPIDFAEQVKLLKTDNPNLTPVVPHHNRITPTAGQTTMAVVGRQVAWLNLEAPRHRPISKLPPTSNALEVTAQPDSSHVVVAAGAPFATGGSRGADLLYLDVSSGDATPLLTRAEARES